MTMTTDRLAAEDRAAFESTLSERLAYMRAGLPEGVWEVWTSNSFRRISTPWGQDGGVLCGTIQRSDGHPDLSMSEEQLQNLVGIINVVPDILSALARLDRMTEALNDCRTEFDHRFRRGDIDKLRTNREMADLCARALGGQVGEG